MGNPALPDSTRRLRNSTWRGTRNVPHCGTRTVLVDFPTSSRAARRATRGAQERLQITTSVRPHRDPHECLDQSLECMSSSSSAFVRVYPQSPYTESVLSQAAP